ncbi:LemA family protein [Oceanisphaera avium]|uniref:LemA family protein n=1 Tax=Oceanisphaera avium TaxID=1903694 RepID=A0A1Y0CXJ1_9GAMM|nr:LemA family protein [Oceanisphaera avium]ART80022.1 LemA family protein [Oceanisphaera avium]
MEIILIIVVIAIIVWFIAAYNNFVKLIEAVHNSEKEISVQLDRRGKVFDSLIATVNRYLEHESEVFTQVTALRAKTLDPSASPHAVKQAQDDLSKMVSSGSINVAVESYPELKSDRNMRQLQEEIVSTENKLSFAKKAFNNAIERYNVAKGSFPSLIIPSLFSNLNHNFEYWSLDEATIKSEEARRVQF